MSIITHDRNGAPTMIAGTPDIAHYDASKNNNVPGIVTLYDTDTVSAKAAGAALHASEKNPAVAGSLAEQIENVDDKVGDPSAASAVAGADAFSKINALNTSLVTIEEYTPITFGGVKCTPYKNGKIVVLVFELGEINTSNWTTLGKLPQALRPPKTLYSTLYVSRNLDAVCSVFVDPQGTIQYVKTVNSEMSGCITYLVK